MKLTIEHDGKIIIKNSEGFSPVKIVSFDTETKMAKIDSELKFINMDISAELATAEVLVTAYLPEFDAYDAETGVLIKDDTIFKQRTRLDEIDSEIKEYQRFLSEQDELYVSLSQGSFAEYSLLREPYQSKIDALYREMRMILPYTLNGKVKFKDNVMSMKIFIELVEEKTLMDSDGFGHYVTDDDHITDIMIVPSDIEHGSIRKDLNRVVWYNK